MREREHFFDNYRAPLWRLACYLLPLAGCIFFGIFGLVINSQAPTVDNLGVATELFYFLLRNCGADHLVEPRFPLLRYYIASLLWLSVLLTGFFFPFSWLQSTTARKHVSEHQARNDKFKTDNAVQAVHGTISFVLWQVGGVSLRAVQGRLHYHDQSH